MEFQTLMCRIYSAESFEELATLCREWSESEGLEVEGTYRQAARSLPRGRTREILHAFADRGMELSNPAERRIARRFGLA